MGTCRSKPVAPSIDATQRGAASKSNQVAPDVAAAEATQGDALSLHLLFVGLDGAGKTSCVNALRKVPGARALPTSGFSKPQTIKLGSHKITLLDLGGGKRIRDIWREYYAEVHGIVFVVDAGERDRGTEAAEALQTAAKHEYVMGKPVLVVANQADKPNGFSVDELRELVALPAECPAPTHYVTGRANADAEGAADTAWLFDGIGWLVNSVRENFADLSARVERETEAKKEANRQKLAAQKKKIESEDWKAGRTDIDGNVVGGAAEGAEDKSAAGAGAADAAAGAGESSATAEKPAESTPAPEADPGVPMCTICKAAPAERRCAAAKWEAVCNPCGERLEAAQ